MGDRYFMGMGENRKESLFRVCRFSSVLSRELSEVVMKVIVSVLLIVCLGADLALGDSVKSTRIYLYLESGFDAKRACLYGSKYNPVTERCELVLSVPCPPGTVYNFDTKRCEKNYGICPGTFDPLTLTCIVEASQNCPSGSTYDANLGVCVSEPAYVCPPGTVLDPTNKVCILQQ